MSLIVWMMRIGQIGILIGLVVFLSLLLVTECIDLYHCWKYTDVKGEEQ